MKKTNKKVLLTTTALMAVAGITTTTVVSCGANNTQKLGIKENKGSETNKVVKTTKSEKVVAKLSKLDEIIGSVKEEIDTNNIKTVLHNLTSIKPIDPIENKIDKLDNILGTVKGTEEVSKRNITHIDGVKQQHKNTIKTDFYSKKINEEKVEAQIKKVKINEGDFLFNRSLELMKKMNIISVLGLYTRKQTAQEIKIAALKAKTLQMQKEAEAKQKLYAKAMTKLEKEALIEELANKKVVFLETLYIEYLKRKQRQEEETKKQILKMVEQVSKMSIVNIYTRTTKEVRLAELKAKTLQMEKEVEAKQKLYAKAMTKLEKEWLIEELAYKKAKLLETLHIEYLKRKQIQEETKKQILKMVEQVSKMSIVNIYTRTTKEVRLAELKAKTLKMQKEVESKQKLYAKAMTKLEKESLIRELASKKVKLLETLHNEYLKRKQRQEEETKKQILKMVEQVSKMSIVNIYTGKKPIVKPVVNVITPEMQKLADQFKDVKTTFTSYHAFEIKNFNEYSLDQHISNPKNLSISYSLEKTVDTKDTKIEMIATISDGTNTLDKKFVVSGFKALESQKAIDYGHNKFKKNEATINKEFVKPIQGKEFNATGKFTSTSIDDIKNIKDLSKKLEQNSNNWIDFHSIINHNWDEMVHYAMSGTYNVHKLPIGMFLQVKLSLNPNKTPDYKKGEAWFDMFLFKVDEENVTVKKITFKVKGFKKENKTVTTNVVKVKKPIQTKKTSVDPTKFKTSLETKKAQEYQKIIDAQLKLEKQRKIDAEALALATKKAQEKRLSEIKFLWEVKQVTSVTPHSIYSKEKALSSNKTYLKGLLNKYKNSFEVNQSFIQKGRGFIETPMTMTQSKLTLNNLGMNALDSLKNTKDVKFTMNIVPHSQNDAEGTMKVSVNLTKGKDTVSREFEIKGFIKTKDVFIDGNKAKTLGDIINSINDQIGLGFAKKIKDMLPQDLKNELEWLMRDTMKGRMTVIGTFNGKQTAIAIDKSATLDKIWKTIGDVKGLTRYSGDTWTLVFEGAKRGIHIGSFTSYAIKYSTALGNGRRDEVVKLIGNMKADFINLFPDLLRVFENVASSIAKLDMVKQWYNSKSFTKVGSLEDILSREIMEWLLRNGNYKDRK